jgi:hypothetical protein
MIDTIHQEMSEVTWIEPYEHNSCAISSYHLTTKWHKHIARFSTLELCGLIVMPKEEEFPGLIHAVQAYLSKATDLIEYTDELVL